MSGWLMAERSPGGPEAPFVARVASVGRRLPETRLTTEELMASTRHRTGIDLERLTGIHERRVSAGEEDSHSLATAAARECLDRADVDGGDLDAVVSCSITKYHGGLAQQMEPPMSTAVAEAIGAAGATSFDISNACAGMLTGVTVLNNWIRRGTIRRGLAVSGEYISSLGRNAARHVRSIVSRELASLTLGDAGAAVLVERTDEGSPGIDLTAFTTVADHSRLCLAYPARHEPGARMFTRSQALQRVAIADVPTVLREALETSGLSLEQIDHVIPHQTSVRAIRKGMSHMAGELGTPRQPVVVTVDHYGNTASTTHFVALYDELATGRARPGDRVVLLALASGLVLGVVLFTVDERLVAANGHDD